MHRRLLLPLLLVTTGACGLAEPGHRARDASQVLHAGVGVSLGPALHVWALAPLFGTSLGYMQDSAYVGSDYGYTAGWHQAAYGVLIGGEMVRAEFGQSVEGFTKRPLYQTYATQSQMLLFNLVVTDERIGKHAQSLSLRRLEAGVHLLAVGVSLGIDLFELLDLGAGVFGWDPAGDDGVEKRHAPFPLPPTPDEYQRARQEEARASRAAEDDVKTAGDDDAASDGPAPDADGRPGGGP